MPPGWTVGGPEGIEGWPAGGLPTGAWPMPVIWVPSVKPATG
jgi:hypothetical protein